MNTDCTPELIALQSSQILNNIFRDDLYDKHLTPDPLGVNVSIELALQVDNNAKILEQILNLRHFMISVN